jgi:16S rRNA (guanine(966)-N(2))-methyltransferase RsmD
VKYAEVVWKQALSPMRIIAGSFRSRSLQAPAGLATRPTSDRLRETLFNVLAPRVEGALFLDLYAGSGAVGIEAISRGASHVTFVERAPAAIRTLRVNLEILGIASGFRVLQESAGSFLRQAPGTEARFDLVFLDPPYDVDVEYETTLGLLGRAAAGRLGTGATVIAEHRRKQRVQESYGRLKRTRLLEQGDAALSFYTVENLFNDEMDGLK